MPTFADIEIDGQSRTAIRLLVECRPAEVSGEISMASASPPGPPEPAARTVPHTLRDYTGSTGP